MYQRAEEVRQRDEKNQEISQAQINGEEVTNGNLHALGLFGDREGDQDQNDCVEVFEGEGEAQAGDADPLKWVHFVSESHIKIDAMEVPHDLPEAADDDPVDNPVVGVEVGDHPEADDVCHEREDEHMALHVLNVCEMVENFQKDEDL